MHTNSTSLSRSNQSGRRHRFARKLAIENLEGRQMMAADLLYTLRARPGVPDTLFGLASDANEQFHVIGNPAEPVYGEPLGAYRGEVQIHDATTGARLRTIANPEPTLGFSFGTTIAIDQNFVLVGAAGVDEREIEEIFPFPDLSGRVYLFDANTGDLIHTFQPDPDAVIDLEQRENLDGFGYSIDIEGNTIVIGAPGIPPSEELDTNDYDDGRVYVFNRTTGNLIQRIDSQDSFFQSGGNIGFGASVSLSQGRVVINGNVNLPPPEFATGRAHIYDVLAGGPQITIDPSVPNRTFAGFLSLDGDVLVADNSHFANFVGFGDFIPSTSIYDADNGSLSIEIPVQTIASDGNLIATPRGTDYLSRIYNLSTGALVDEIGIPASMSSAISFDPFLSIFHRRIQIHDQRVLVSAAADGVGDHPGVYVFSLNGPLNQPPTDIALSNSTIPENSPNATIIGTFTATDPTPGETFTFSLLNNSSGRFALDGNQLQVANGNLLDFDTQLGHAILVRVTDSAGNTYDEVITILLTNVNEPSTNITVAPQTVVENAPNNMLVGNLASNDPDSPDPQTFTLLDNAGGRFTLDGTGIRVADGSLLDYETATSHTISVQVTDSLGLSFIDTLTIQVVNVPDAAPTDLALRNNTVVENSPNGTLVAALDNPIAATNFGGEIASGGFGSNAFLAIGRDGFASATGQVQILRPKTGETLLTISNPTPSINDRFGNKVVTTDQRVIVAAPGDDTAGNNVGAVYVFDRTTGVLERTITPPNTAGQGFGNSMSVDGNSLVVGNFNGITDVYVFNIVTGQLLNTLALSGFFGPSSVFIDSERIYLGDFRFDQLSGRVLVFERATGNLLQTILNPDSATPSGDFFGNSLTVTSNRLIVGARGQDVGESDTGAIYVFNSTTGDLLQTLTQSTPEAFSSMGRGLVAGGGRVLALAPVSDAAGEFAGRAYLFDLVSGGLIKVIEESPVQDFGNFGSAATYLDDEFFIGSTATIGVILNGQYNAYQASNGLLVDGFITTDPEPNQSHTYQLLDSAGGRFALVDNNLVVANSSLLNFEVAASHDVVVRVTDSQGLSLDKTLTIQLLDVVETAPTDLSLVDSYIQEGSPNGTQVALITSPLPRLDGTFALTMDTDGNRTIFGSSNFQGTTATEGRIFVRDDLTGEIIQTFKIPANDIFISSVAISGNLAVVGAGRDDALGQDVGRAFVFDVTTGALLHTLSPTVQTPNMRFGFSIDVRNDTVVVGTLHGQRAYVFDSATGQLSFELNQPGGEFGTSVAISDNGRVVVGDPGAASFQGRVFVYNKSTGDLMATINNPTPNAGDRFGESIEVSDPFLLVGAPRDDHGATNSGRAYLFDLNSFALFETFDNPSPANEELFGIELDLTFSRAAIGNRNFNGGSPEIAVFDNFGGELKEVIPTNAPINSIEFGSQGLQASLSVPGSGGVVRLFDSLNWQTLSSFRVTDDTPTPTYTYSLLDNAGGRFAIVGDQLVVANGSLIDYQSASSHTVTVQVTDGSGLSFTKDLTVNVISTNLAPSNIQISNSTVTEDRVRFLHHPSVAKGTNFGYDTDADGNKVIIGTNNLTNNVGEVYVTDAATGALVASLTSQQPQNGEAFGSDVSISGNRAVVSASLRDVGGFANAGQAYIYDATTGGLLHTLNHPNPFTNVKFGTDVAMSGDLVAVASQSNVYLFSAVTGNLLFTSALLGTIRSIEVVGNTLVVGAHNVVHVIEFNPATQTATLIHTLDNPTANAVDAFGSQIAANSNFIAVSALFNDQPTTDSGVVYVYDRVTGNLLYTIVNPSPSVDDQFGNALAINGNLLAVAAQMDDTDATDSGQVYLFSVTTGTLLSTIKNPSPNVGDFFSRVSFAGNRLVVGSPTDDTDGNNLGMTYVFDLNSPKPVGVLTAVDANPGDSITFSLINDAGGRFMLQGNTILVTDTALIDASVNATHDIVVRATDANGLFSDKTLTIQVLTGDQPPRNITFSGTTVVERAANQTVVSTLTTADPNAGNTFTYSLLNSAGGRFAIVGNTIVVANGVAIDFETAAAHSVIVQTTDSSGLSTFESFRITVVDAVETFDFGDLPTSFGTLLAGNGPRHEVFLGSPRLGASVSIDNDGQPNAGATLDNFDDGVILPPLIIPNLNAVFTVNASTAGKLDAFIDFGGNGNFSESERITPVGGLQLVAGLNTFTAAIPATAGSGNRGARFRFSTAGGLGPTGVAADGEVEDYRIDVVAPANLSSQLLPDPENPGQTIMFVRGSAFNDVIAVDPVGAGLRATINGVQGPTLAAVDRIVMFAVSGNDDVRINTTTIPGYIDGGLGNDTIRGGNGPDLLFGRAGDDVIFGRGGIDLIYGSSGNDQLFSDSGAGILFGEGNDDILVGTGILVGGDGVDTLTATGSRNVLVGGNNGDSLTGANIDQGDILIAGPTIYDSNVSALYAIREEWRLNAPVLDRIAHLNGTTIGGLNGSFRLDEATVLVENQADTITNFGTTNALRDDWIFLSAGDIKVNLPGIVVVVDGFVNGASEGTLPELLGIYTNYSLPADVNFDDQITPLDALLLIDGLNRRLRGPVAKMLPGEESYFDVNDDLQISPLDVLFVIDQLNRRTSPPSAGEGESPLAHDIALAELASDLESHSSWNGKRKRHFARAVDK